MSVKHNDQRERCAANEPWRFQCDDGRRTAIKTALNTKIEDGNHLTEDVGRFQGSHKYIISEGKQHPSVLHNGKHFALSDIRPIVFRMKLNAIN
ncbi:hypothetical protein T4D_15712 [Trichinella pseudospiralis]|uniref:Uncharacterized protein n=1 Tax=Trichinella pseudospiralis TaxID=6337 RepID=A0A0V1F9A7_TRIPS|nr:hypothetical protein T4D_15712 [Trichinella pseudospiralis]